MQYNNETLAWHNQGSVSIERKLSWQLQNKLTPIIVKVTAMSYREHLTIQRNESYEGFADKMYFSNKADPLLGPNGNGPSTDPCGLDP